MGRLVNGQWTTEFYKSDKKGRFLRDPTQFRKHVSSDGSTPFPATPGRYHLYVSLACPWAHRTLIVRQLRGLRDAISVSIVDPFMGDEGWTLRGAPGATLDEINHKQTLWQVYTQADPNYTGRVTVPVLWDRQQQTIVNNESRDIIRMFNRAFLEVGDPNINLCPPDLTETIDAELDAMYEPINNGVYRSGFATTQQAYEEAVAALFTALEAYDDKLGSRRYLCGKTLTEADICLFTTLVRFDLVYHYHFKCNLKKIDDFVNLSGYVRDVFQHPGVAQTCNFEHIKLHYYSSHEIINPTRIVPKGPVMDFTSAHGREKL